MIFDIKDKTAIITYESSDTIGRPFYDEIKRNYKYFSSLNIVVDLSTMKPDLTKHIMMCLVKSGFIVLKSTTILREEKYL